MIILLPAVNNIGLLVLSVRSGNASSALTFCIVVGAVSGDGIAPAVG